MNELPENIAFAITSAIIVAATIRMLTVRNVVHAAVGRVSFDNSALNENVRALMDAVVRARPASAKGRYLKSVHISSTMGPGIKIDYAALR